MKYNRILLKLSGESLQGAQGYGLSTDVLHSYAAQIRQAVEAGVQVAVVIGGGNIFRGLQGAGRGFDRVKGDQMGMLATIINSLALQSALENDGVRPCADVNPHGAYRRILRQGTRFGVPRGRRGGHHRRRDVESLLHDRFGGGAARRGDRSRRPAQRNPRGRRLHGRSRRKTPWRRSSTRSRSTRYTAAA